MPRTALHAPSAPACISLYSHGVWSGHEIFLSGQTPINPTTGRLIDGDIAEQTHRVFDNLEGVLRKAGLSLDDVVKCNVSLTDMAEFAAMNAADGARFAAPYPARTTVAVAGLPLVTQVEIELLARRATAK